MKTKHKISRAGDSLAILRYNLCPIFFTVMIGAAEIALSTKKTLYFK
jgi:hypothetical protein